MSDFNVLINTNALDLSALDTSWYPGKVYKKHLPGMHNQQNHAGSYTTYRIEDRKRHLDVGNQILGLNNVSWQISRYNPAINRKEFDTWAKDSDSFTRILALGEYVAHQSNDYYLNLGGTEGREAIAESFDDLLGKGVVKNLGLASFVGPGEDVEISETDAISYYVQKQIEGSDYPCKTLDELYLSGILDHKNPIYAEVVRNHARLNTDHRRQERIKTARRLDPYPQPDKTLQKVAANLGYKPITSWKELSDVSDKYRNCVALEENGWPDKITHYNGKVSILDAGDACLAVKRNDYSDGLQLYYAMDSLGMENEEDPDPKHTGAFIDMLNTAVRPHETPPKVHETYHKSINPLSIKHLPGQHDQKKHGVGRQISDERRKQLSEWGRKGGITRGAQMTSDEMKEMRKKVKTSSLIRSGRLGYEAVAAKYGPGHAASLFANYRRENPSANIRIASTWLTNEGIKYDTEVGITDTMFADFIVPKQPGIKNDTMLECDEEIWHRQDPLHGEDRPAIDHLKDITAKEYGYNIIRVTGTQIRDGSARDIILRKLRS